MLAVQDCLLIEHGFTSAPTQYRLYGLLNRHSLTNTMTVRRMIVFMTISMLKLGTLQTLKWLCKMYCECNIVLFSIL